LLDVAGMELIGLNANSLTKEFIQASSNKKSPQYISGSILKKKKTNFKRSGCHFYACIMPGKNWQKTRSEDG